MHRTAPMLVSLLLTAAWGLAAETSPSTTAAASHAHTGHPSRVAHLTFRDGTCEDVALEGVGCPVAICSRVAIQSRGAGSPLAQTSLDDISALESVNGSE